MYTMNKLLTFFKTTRSFCLFVIRSVQYADYTQVRECVLLHIIFTKKKEKEREKCGYPEKYDFFTLH